MANTTDTVDLKSVPGYRASAGGIQIGATISHDAGDEELELIEQLGVEWVMVNVNDPEMHTLDAYRKLVARLANYGLKIYRIANHGLHNMDVVTLNLPGREEKIEEFTTFLANISAVGVKYHTYAHMANGIWSSDPVPIRGGASARSWDPDTSIGHWRNDKYQGALTHGREYSSQEIWENYEYFIKCIAPIAEEHGVYIGIHPDDPPVQSLGGIPRCIFGSFDGYRRAIEIADSPNIGVCLCVGCWLEGGEAIGASVTEAIEYFAGIGKLFKVHFRNVSNPMPEAWHETFGDDGYMDMSLVMRSLQNAGYDGCVIADHIPSTSGGRSAGFSYSIGYIRGLIQAGRSENVSSTG